MILSLILLCVCMLLLVGAAFCESLEKVDEKRKKKR
jgi:hypothetical protein